MLRFFLEILIIAAVVVALSLALKAANAERYWHVQFIMGTNHE